MNTYNTSVQSNDRQPLRAVIADLYGIIGVLDSAQQSDFAGRLHALALEVRERVATEESR